VDPQEQAIAEALIEEIRSAIQIDDAERLKAALSRFGALYLERPAGGIATPITEAGEALDGLPA
jgi:hypothetical protein